ncbi:MAG TPA: hypothetical protein DEA88_02555 [Erwinia persicina]|nr:hypothetical protein [Erwinia persicina]
MAANGCVVINTPAASKPQSSERRVTESGPEWLAAFCLAETKGAGIEQGLSAGDRISHHIIDRLTVNV